MSNVPSAKRLFAYFVLGAGLAVCALAAYTWTQRGEPQRKQPRRASALSAPWQQRAPERKAGAGWTVGQLRADGLRLQPSGRSDSSAVLDPEQFYAPQVRRAYAHVRAVSSTINKLYCWCRCENRGQHRSNLACFEDRMAVNCDVCRGTAEIAYRMTRQGVTDAGTIQAAVDKAWGPEWAKQERQKQQG